MRLQLPRSLHYPITVTKLLKRPSDNVDRLEPLFEYSYETTVTEGDGMGGEVVRQRTFPSRYESPVEGVLEKWRVQDGTVIESHYINVAEIEEPCPHSIQFGGMCTLCGKDMTTISYNTDVSNTDRATINMIHDNTALTVSQDVSATIAPCGIVQELTSSQEATRVEEEAKRRLLKSKKLSLVVDLDLTIIQATVDPTVAEWQKDTTNPNHGAVKDVRAFQLIDEGPGGRGCWYYIKLRPGLKEFLENISKIYELHIYTMGTRAYAQHIAAIVDPARRVFGDRILSRDESGSLVAKNLQRLFPVDTKMVVIIDDRGDVWKWNDNLLRVLPYDFFVGIGDINSSFLTKREEIQASPKPAEVTVPDDNKGSSQQLVGEQLDTEMADEQGPDKAPDASRLTQSSDPAKGDVSALEQLVSMGGGDDPAVLQQQAEKQDEALAAQLEDRPLLQKQKLLDAEDDAAAAAENLTHESNNSESQHPREDALGEPAKQRHHLLQDDDNELQYLERSLAAVHRAFYEEHDRQLAKIQGGRVAQLRGERHKKRSPNADLDVVPDVGDIMPQMKLRVLEGVVIVFSGVVPLGTDIYRADIAIWARSFGAIVHEHISKRTTHVVAARNRTAKVRQAARRPSINIVTTQWMYDSLSQWQRLYEEPYLIPVHPEDRNPPASGSKGDSSSASKLEPSSSFLSSSEEDVGESDDSDDGGGAAPSSSTIGLRLNTATGDFDDPDGVAPPSLAGDHSPIDGFEDYDWKGVQDDLAEYLGSDNESDTDSTVSTPSADSTTLSPSRKRKRSRSASPVAHEPAADSNGPEVAQDQASTTSRLHKRQQRARERGTGLKAVTAVAEERRNGNGASLPSPAVTGGEEVDDENDEDASGDEGRAVGDSEVEGEADRDVDNDDDDLERDLEAEMEREMDGEG
ncbi:MAG: Carboxy-terminal domain (CTD) phosphatase [Piccolia ochrophora]|nr:MAG: Carboxy-terminal domain (CTD) phosphatase [Piccolia ochrophora]